MKYLCLSGSGLPGHFAELWGFLSLNLLLQLTYDEQLWAENENMTVREPQGGFPLAFLLIWWAGTDSASLKPFCKDLVLRAGEYHLLCSVGVSSPLARPLQTCWAVQS